MAASTKKDAKGLDPRAQLLADLKEWLSEHDYNQARNTYLSAHIYAASYAWVRYTVDSGSASTITEACERLAGSIKRTYIQATDWYHMGRVMAEYKFNPEKVNSQSVRDLWQWHNSVTEHERAKIVTLIRNGAARREIRKVITGSKYAAQRRGDKIASALVAKGQLNKTNVKVHLMAVNTLAARLFERDVVIEVHDAETGKLLLDAK